MQLAIKEAEKAYDNDEVPVGAIITIDNSIIARGYNMTERLTDVTAHAEIIALTAAFNNLGTKYLPQATIYITLEPCPMCAGALFWSQIGKIVIGAADVKHGCMHQKNTGTDYWPFHPKTQLITDIESNKCSTLLTSFFKRKR